jgi:mRNA interferase HicA
LTIYTYTCKLALWYEDVKRRKLKELLRRLGWRLLRHGGDHDIWSRDGGRIMVPRQNEINEYTARGILKDAREEV